MLITVKWRSCLKSISLRVIIAVNACNLQNDAITYIIYWKKLSKCSNMRIPCLYIRSINQAMSNKIQNLPMLDTHKPRVVTILKDLNSCWSLSDASFLLGSIIDAGRVKVFDERFLRESEVEESNIQRTTKFNFLAVGVLSTKSPTLLWLYAGEDKLNHVREERFMVHYLDASAYWETWRRMIEIRQTTTRYWLTIKNSTIPGRLESRRYIMTCNETQKQTTLLQNGQAKGQKSHPCFECSPSRNYVSPHL